MSMEFASLVAGRATANVRLWSYVRAVGKRVLAALMAAMRPLFRAMQESNRRKAAQILQNHPALFDDLQ